MHHQRRAVERIVDAEVMKLERRRALERAEGQAISQTASRAGRVAGQADRRRVPGSA
jgi:hypothetical protein